MEKFDLSKLKRRQPDMKNISAPRFKFPGWVLINEYWEVIPEDRFGYAKPGTTAITLPRDPRWATLTIKRNLSGWHLVSGCLQEGIDHTVWVTDGDFQTIVTAAENYVLQAISRQDHHVLRRGSDDREWRNFAEFSGYLDELMLIWRKTSNEEN